MMRERERDEATYLYYVCKYERGKQRQTITANPNSQYTILASYTILRGYTIPEIFNFFNFLLDLTVSSIRELR